MLAPILADNKYDDFQIEELYVPSTDLTIRLADRIEALEYEAMRDLKFKEKSDAEDPESDNYLQQVPTSSAADSSNEIQAQQRLLVEELDSCLADSAETDEAMNGQRIDIQKTITEGMSDALGLSRDDELLIELASGFRDWIDQRGSFTAAWGEIISTNDGYMYLNAFEPQEELNTEPAFTGVYPSAKAPKTFLAKVAAKLGIA